MNPKCERFKSAFVSVICPNFWVCLTIPLEKQTHDIITYVDIKSSSLRDILRSILKGVKTARLEGDKPAVQVLVSLFEGSLTDSSLGWAKFAIPFSLGAQEFWHRLRRRYDGGG